MMTDGHQPLTEVSRSSDPPALAERLVLITGASGLLGRLVTAELLARGCRIIALLRPGSPYTLDSLRAALTACGNVPAGRTENLQILRGDVWEPDLGLGPDVLERLFGITEIVHLARPRVGEELLGALVKGLDGIIDVARRLGGIRRLVVLSSTEVAGDYHGRFYEDWLDIGQTLSTQKTRELLETEARAREAASYLPLCIVRHALLVGHSRTGHIECDAGFDRLFALGRYVSKLPSFLRLPGPGAGRRYVTISPIDYVAAGLAELTFNDEVRRTETFCLADPDPPELGELFELLLDRIGGPPPGLRFPVEGKGAVGRSIDLVARIGATMTGVLGKGASHWGFLLQRGEHDVSNARRVLEPLGIDCPRLATYFDALYEDFRRRQQRSHD